MTAGSQVDSDRHWIVVSVAGGILALRGVEGIWVQGRIDDRAPDAVDGSRAALTGQVLIGGVWGEPSKTGRRRLFGNLCFSS